MKIVIKLYVYLYYATSTQNRQNIGEFQIMPTHN